MAQVFIVYWGNAKFDEILEDGLFNVSPKSAREPIFLYQERSNGDLFSKVATRDREAINSQIGHALHTKYLGVREGTSRCGLASRSLESYPY